MNEKNLPSSITSYDLLKSAALILMIIDHTGAFFFPEEEWFRVIGRMSAPIWLFLVGYARSRDLSSPLWIGTILIVLTSFGLGEPILPLCILMTILLCRTLIDPLMLFIREKPSALYPITALIFAGGFLTFTLIEYGVAALLFVMVGYMVRNWESLPFTKSQLMQFAVIASGLYAVFQLSLFIGFTLPQNLVAGMGVLFTGMALTAFYPAVYPEATNRIPKPVVWLLQFCGRRTLEIYVIHFILFKIAASLMLPEMPQFFSLHIL